MCVGFVRIVSVEVSRSAARYAFTLGEYTLRNTLSRLVLFVRFPEK